MKRIACTAFLAAVVMILPAAASADSTISQMATMVINLNHYPSEAEKKVLAGIVADEHASRGEKVIAGALMRMQHRVAGSDAEKLMQLESDESASGAERELAAILRGIAHHPTPADIERLKAIAR